MMAALDGVPTAMPELVVDGDTGLFLEDACAALPDAILLPQLILSWSDSSCLWTRIKNEMTAKEWPRREGKQET
jgi:hypothetical protein